MITATQALQRRGAFYDWAVCCMAQVQDQHQLGRNVYISDTYDVVKPGTDPDVCEPIVTIWRPDIFRLALTGSDSFTGIMVPFDPAFARTELWLFEEEPAVDAVGLDVEPGMRAHNQDHVPDDMLKAITKIYHRDHTGKLVYYMAYTDSQSKNRAFICASKPIDPDVPIDDPIALTTQCVAADLFRRQRIAADFELPPSRPERRRAEREGKALPSVRYVSLRKRDHAAGSIHEALSRQYHCQWLVGGHWRKQWFASRNEHRPIWIEPYIKGPADKPLKPHTTTIFHAIR